MRARDIFPILLAIPFALVHFLTAQTGAAGLFAKVAERSRQLADAGKWDEAKTILADQLTQTKDAAQTARLKAELALLALAEFEAEQKNLAEAIRLVEQAIPLAESGNSPRALYSAQLTLAKWYADEGKTAKAKELAEQSRAGAEAFGNTSDMKEAEDFLRRHA